MPRISRVFLRRKLRQSSLGPDLGCSAAAGDRRYDKDRLAIPDSRFHTVKMPDIFVADVNVYKISQRILLVIKVFPQFAVLGRKFIQRLARRSSLNLDL
jgi:hypothetical protein